MASAREIAFSARIADEPPTTGSAAWACASQTTNTEPMRSSNLLRWTAITTSLGLGLLLPATAQPTLESFTGRYETAVSKCVNVTSEGTSARCWRIQIDGRTASVLSIHFFGDGQEKGSIEKLTFVVSLSDSTAPLRCHLGRCQLEAQRWVGRVNSVSIARYDSDGLAISVPNAWPAKAGQCAREDNRIRCLANGSNGGQVIAEATI